MGTDDKKKILVVEDELALRTAYREALSEAGYEVIEAENGENGLELALLKRPHLILLDLLMPVKDGRGMMKELRAGGNKTPIIILTNINPGDEVMSEILHSQPAWYFIKVQLSIYDLIRKINEILTSKQGVF